MISNKQSENIFKVIYIALIGMLLFEVFRSAGREADFGGYVNAGRLFWQGDFIYSDWRNTWPPFFSVFSSLLYFGELLSPYFLRLLWLTGSLIAFYIIFKEVLSWLGKKLCFKREEVGIYFLHPLVFFSFLLSFRFVLENLANVQINIYLLLCCVLCFRWIKDGRPLWAGAILAFAISLKVFPVFLLFYFIYKRAYKVLTWSLVFLIGNNLFAMICFGWETAVENYVHWFTEVAPNSYIAHHKNQSVFGLFYRLFLSGEIGFVEPINFASLKLTLVNKMVYGSVVLAALYPLSLFRKKFESTYSVENALEWSVVLAVIPLISPLAWKAYFIFLFPLMMVSLFRLFFNDESRLQWIRSCFFIGTSLLLFSWEIFAGRYISDVMEAYGAVSFGAICLIIVGLGLWRSKTVNQSLKSPTLD